MKKTIVLILMLYVSCVGMTLALDKKTRPATLEFTLNYRPDTASPLNERVMKNTILLDNKWVVAGKLISSKTDESILLLVHILTHKNNKYNLQFMLVDSSNGHTYITEPRMSAIIGLPMQMNQQGDGKSIQMNALVKIADKQPV